MSETVNIVGYSFDSILEAVVQSTRGKRVKYWRTAAMAEPLDTFHDMITARYADMLEILLPGIEFTEVRNPRHIYIPYETVRVDNRSNGIFQMPFSKNTFSEADHRGISDAFKCAPIQDCYSNKSATPSKLITAMKNNMPQGFVDTFTKALNSTRWRGIQLSHLTMFGFEYEYSFEHIDEDYNETYCRPKESYAAICERLISTFGIDVVDVKPVDIKKMIKDRYMDGELIIMDNRVDYYMDYVCGKFDRVEMSVTEVKMPRNFALCSDGIYYTPFSDFWGVIIEGDRAFTCSASKVASLNLTGVSEIPLTRNNVKLHEQYRKMIKLYGNKRIDIGQRVETLVK